MQRTTCPDCGCVYWRKSIAHEKHCPACGGTGDATTRCSECGKPIRASEAKCGRKTCGKPCSLAREARLARERRAALTTGQGIERWCAHCGTPFTAPNKLHKTCSPECSAARKRILSATASARAPYRTKPQMGVVGIVGADFVFEESPHFTGQSAPGVPWAHVWSGLDPLPAGSIPARFTEAATEGHQHAA